MTYYDRSAWGARSPKANPVRMNPANVTKTYIHHGATPATNTADASIRAVRVYQNFHMDTRGWNDIAYSFLVDQLGNVFEGRGWLIVGGHTQGQNSVSHAICWIGNGETPTPAALASIAQLVSEAQSRVGHSLIVLPHSSAPGANTSCPGDKLRAWIAAGRPVNGVPAPTTPAGDATTGSAYPRKGSQGPAVLHIQQRLNAHSVNDPALKVHEDSDFGSDTDRAVRKFQADVGVAQDGIVGPTTLGILDTVPVTHTAPAPSYPTLRRGAKGGSVPALQTLLNKQGAKLKVDGDFGPGTEAAVRGFQKRRGLAVDGIVGPATWKALA